MFPSQRAPSRQTFDATLVSSNGDRGVVLSDRGFISRTKQTIHCRREHILSIPSACWKSDIKGNRSQDIGLGRTKVGSGHDVAERVREASSWSDTEGYGDIVNGLNVIGGCEGYGEWVVSIDSRGCGNACDDGGGRGDEGREEKSS